MTALGIYRPGNTPLHATPAWVKVLGLLLLGVTTIIFHEPVTSIGLMAAALLFLVSVNPPLRATIKGLAVIAIIAALAGSFHWWVGDIPRAITTSANLMAIVAAALAVSGSTSMESMLALISRMLQPLRRIVPPETIGMMFAIMIRAVPYVAQLLAESTQAARARGLRGPKAVLVPTVTRTVGFALDLGQALHARGIADESPRR